MVFRKPTVLETLRSLKKTLKYYRFTSREKLKKVVYRLGLLKKYSLKIKKSLKNPYMYKIYVQGVLQKWGGHDQFLTRKGKRLSKVILEKS